MRRLHNAQDRIVWTLPDVGKPLEIHPSMPGRDVESHSSTRSKDHSLVLYAIGPLTTTSRCRASLVEGG